VLASGPKAKLAAMPMKVSVIGLGYLGATHAVAMAELGHEVVGLEADPARLTALESGKLPFYEPGLDEALQRVLASGRLRFAAAHSADTADCDVHFLAVGTPQLPGSNAADTSYLFSAIDSLAAVLQPSSVIAGKSTVPVGTAAALTARLASQVDFAPRLVWNPEFLREGTALEDSLRPDRIVVGVPANDAAAAEVIRSVYEPILSGSTGSAPGATPFLVMDLATSELVKVAANSFLATKISFINAMAEIAEAAGADAVQLAEAIGMDERIGNKFLRTGIGFGGGCLPKDIRAFMARAEELGVGSAVEFLADVDAVNLRRRARVVALAQQELGSLAGRRVLMLGASFKPESDDLRDSPALSIARELASLGAQVVVHDPMSLEGVARVAPELEVAADLGAAFAGAELTVLGTEWRVYRELDPAVAGAQVSLKTVIDGRNALDAGLWQAAGWRVIALGRNLEAGASGTGASGSGTVGAGA
jgi:UDPglucose 6-dehydrogenase